MQLLLFWHVGWQEFTKSAMGKGLKGNVEAMEKGCVETMQSEVRKAVIQRAF